MLQTGNEAVPDAGGQSLADEVQHLLREVTTFIQHLERKGRRRREEGGEGKREGEGEGGEGGKYSHLSRRVVSKKCSQTRALPVISKLTQLDKRGKG